MFSQKYCMGADGDTQFLPKSNRYSRMISGFISCSLVGVGLHLADMELHEVNKRRMGCEWGHYFCKIGAMSVYGSTKKEDWRESFLIIFLWCWDQLGGLLELWPDGPPSWGCKFWEEKKLKMLVLRGHCRTSGAVGI